MSNTNNETASESNNDLLFADLNLSREVLENLSAIGYEKPTPIQAEIIPHVLSGRDVIGQAQTGTGKTAAFALPLLSNVDTKQKKPQILVLTPTRELAIQVATAFESYSPLIKGFKVLPIYGGQNYNVQLSQLRSGVQVIVGTPGRIMDHLRRGTLKLDELSSLVLDEADEMLRMGFIDDVEWILDKTPESRQIALFSATMPPEIKRIATNYLDDPKLISIKSKTSTSTNVKQSFLLLNQSQKQNALARILETSVEESAIIFVRTKLATVDICDFLKSKGIQSEALNGDIQQRVREKIIDKAKQGRVKVLVATDVAARGLDIENITHVINYDIPFDTETYIHRIGRTGRAGRKGEAILFITPKEKRLLFSIERTTKQNIVQYELPSVDDINAQRVEKFISRIESSINPERNKQYYDIIRDNELLSRFDQEDLVASLMAMSQGRDSLLIPEDTSFSLTLHRDEGRGDRNSRDRGGRDRDRNSRDRSGRDRDRNSRDRGGRERNHEVPENMQRYRIEVGRAHDIMPKNIVGAIANETGISSSQIGHIKLFDQFSTVDLPKDLSKEVFEHLQKTRVGGEAMKLSVDKGAKKRPSGGGNDRPRRRNRN